MMSCCLSLYFVSKFKSRKNVFIAKKHVIYHDIVQEIKFKNERFPPNRNISVAIEAFLVAWLALLSLFGSRCPITVIKFTFAF